uniref:Beta-lactamase-related domain-containing protein n=1 Tax=Arion vulgaris TaxID=1028688 RepID=A0A0B7AC50_9EUPU
MDPMSPNNSPSGFVAPGFEKVLSVLSDRFACGEDRSCSFAAYYRGQPVVHIWGGYADAQCKSHWKEDTIGFFYSTTKFVASVTIAHMIERGLLKYNEKISTYWPEFAENGKENITLEMFLSHRAGLAVLSENFDLRWMIDNPRLLNDMLVKQKPFWVPGEAHGYHSITFGLYLNEIVKRVDRKGRNLSEYYQEEIALPFGIDFYIGLPKPLHYRTVRLDSVTLTQELQDKQMQDFKGDPVLLQLSATQPKDWNAMRKLNDPDFLEIPVSSSHGAGTALAMAKLSGILANGGKHEGKTLLSPNSIAKLQEPLSHGTDMVLSGNAIFGRGTCLFPVVEGEKNWFMYGHTGYGDQCSAADPHYNVGWAYTTNYLDTSVSITGKHKWQPLVAALFECVHKLNNVQVETKFLSSYEELQQERQYRKLNSRL